ncbi:hypothetical protein CSB45_14875 [candidate division KSB3 bacterium]|uniref:Uncharacterized protein n=1 Tax=candidate division KSB3 bacterium TaxID=2044937 RepID=A0A2G6E0V5_9BACT|nr:MAG: hypothetical protein CSB45_14875 [candidate division KSB3 bacterium]PIE28351.1 MAG: hypothetical protein CSA57_14355 [candidate division KSB3 bacterium]
MTRDDEIIQRFEERAGAILGKAQQFLTTTLPGGPGVFSYVVMSNLVSKLFGNVREYVESAVSRPLTIPDFVYVEPLDEELEEFFEDERFYSLRRELPEKYESFNSDDWLKLRGYYRPLYYTFYYKDPFMVDFFSFEIQNHDLKRIILDYDALPAYKQVLNSTPSASRQSALWEAVSSILKNTVDDIWSKQYAKELFENAKEIPEVAKLVTSIKDKIRERVEIDELMDLYNDIKYISGRSLSESLPETPQEPPMPSVQYVTSVLPGGHLVVPGEVIRRFHLQSVTKMRVILVAED